MFYVGTLRALACRLVFMNSFATYYLLFTAFIAQEEDSNVIWKWTFELAKTQEEEQEVAHASELFFFISSVA